MSDVHRSEGKGMGFPPTNAQATLAYPGGMPPAKPSIAPVPRLALNVKEACAALGISWDVWKEHVEPDMRLVRIGARKLVPVAELERWLKDNAASTIPQ